MNREVELGRKVFVDAREYYRRGCGARILPLVPRRLVSSKSVKWYPNSSRTTQIIYGAHNVI